MDLILKDMTCGGCAKAVTRIVTKFDPQAEVVIDLPGQRVAIRSNYPETELRQALSRGGFPPEGGAL